MITIDGTTNIENVRTTEMYKIFNLQRVKILSVSLPKTLYSLEEAIEMLKRAKTISRTIDGDVITHYLNGMMTAKEDFGYINVYLFNPNTVRSENVAARVAELEEKNAMLEECVLEMSEIVYA